MIKCAKLKVDNCYYTIFLQIFQVDKSLKKKFFYAKIIRLILNASEIWEILRLISSEEMTSTKQTNTL